MATFQSSTDRQEVIQLDSAIEQVAWSRSAVACGASVGLSVFTRFVGNGAGVRIEIVDGEGRRHGILEGRIAGNRLRALFQVPPRAGHLLVATARLPEHGLELSSPALVVLPPVEITNARWSAEEARRGDVLGLTADVRGAPDGTEAEISVWEHDDDGAHDLVTRFPILVDDGRVEAEWAFEYIEDVDDIPTEEETERGYHPPEYFFRVHVAGVVAESALLHFQDYIEIQLEPYDARYMTDVAYILHLPDGTERRGTLDEEGRAVERDVPPGRVRVTFPDADAHFPPS